MKARLIRPEYEGGNPVNVLAGRVDEQRQLHAAAESAWAGEATLVLVQGPPGIGKTALVQRFLGDLQEFTILSATATPTDSGVAHGCLSQILRPAAVPHQIKRSSGEGSGPAATRPPTAGSGASGLRQFMDSVAVGPLAIFLDEAQWADGATLRALAEAVHTGGRLCVVLAGRHAPPWDEETWGVLHRLRSISTIRLRELEAAEAADLVSRALCDTPDGVLTKRFLRLSGHHPMYISGLLSQVAGLLPGDPSWPGHVPSDVVGRQLRGVSRAGVEALEALAVLGNSAPVATLVRVLGETDRAFDLDMLIREEFVTIGAAHAPTVTLTHSALSDALYERIPFGRRRALHRAAAPAVDWRHRPGHRVAAAESLNSRLEADVLDVVENELGDSRLLQAARLLASTARLPSEDHLADHLLYGAIRLLFWAGADTELSRYASTVATRRPCPWRDEALGLTEFAAGRLTSARQYLERAQEFLQTGEKPEQRAVILAELALVHVVLGQGEAARRCAELALRPSSAGPADGPAAAMPCAATDVVIPPGTARAAYALRAYGTALQQGARQGLDLLSSLPQDADEIPDEDIPALTVRGMLRLVEGRIASAGSDLTMAFVRGRPGGGRLFGGAASVHLATCHLLNGDWTQASAQIETALADEQSHTVDTAALWSLRSTLEAFRGNETSADISLARAHEMAQRMDFSGPQYHTAVARAMGARARGDHRGVVSALQVLAEHFDHSERVRVVMTSWLPFLAESLINCGLSEQAQIVLKELKAASDGSNRVLNVAETWLHGRLAEAAGHADAAACRYEEAIHALGPGRDIPLIRGLLETSCGRVLASLGQVEAAADHFTAAENIYSRLGARAFLTEYRAQYRAAMPSAELMAGQKPLTERERQVAHLISLGHANKEMADELMLSVKTIEYHLRSIFAKLGVRNRRELRQRMRSAEG